MEYIFQSKRTASRPANVYKSDFFQLPFLLIERGKKLPQISSCQLLFLFVSCYDSLPLLQKEIPAAYGFFFCKDAVLSAFESSADFICQLCQLHTGKNFFYRITLMNFLKQKALKKVKRKSFCSQPGRDISGPEQIAGPGSGIEQIINLLQNIAVPGQKADWTNFPFCRFSMDKLAEPQSCQSSVNIAQFIENRIFPGACVESEIHQSPVDSSGNPGHIKRPPGISYFLRIRIKKGIDFVFFRHKNI